MSEKVFDLSQRAEHFVLEPRIDEILFEEAADGTRFHLSVLTDFCEVFLSQLWLFTFDQFWSFITFIETPFEASKNNQD